jgi:cytochrome c oxidase subunit 4
MSTVKTYLRITGMLLVLLALTVAIAFVNLGAFNTAVAMLISVAKAALIIVFFMHLPRQHPLARLFACAGLFWLGILLVLALSDYLTR